MTAVALALLAGGCLESAPAPTPLPPRASHAVTGLETATGSFTGASGYDTRGTASVFWTGSEWVVSLGSDFHHGGSPSPSVGLGTNGVYDPASRLGPLKAPSGEQVYPLAPGLDIGDYFQVYIWSDELSVPVGIADLVLL